MSDFQIPVTKILESQRTEENWGSLIVEKISEVLFSLDKNWNFTYTNNYALSTWQRTKESLLGKSMWEEFPSLLGTKFEKFYRETMGTDKAQNIEDYSNTSDSWFEVRAYPIQDGLIVYFQNITERKKLEQALKKSEERFRLLSSAAFEGIVIHDKGVIIDVNQTAAKLFGYNNPEEMLGLNGQTLIVEENIEDIKKLLSQGYDGVYEGMASRKDGTHFANEGQGRSIEYGGKMVRMVAFRDITERKQREQELKESEERFHILSDASFDIVLIQDDGIILEANQAAVDLTGYSREELVGKSILSLCDVKFHPETKKRQAEKMVGSFKNAVVRKDGTVFPVEGRRKQISYQGHPVIVASARDTSAQENLIKTQNQLVQAQKMESVGRLAGGLAHDFNNLLTAITGYTELILMSLDEEDEIYSDLSEIKRAANRAATLTRQLLAFSRQQVLQPKVINLNEVVADMDKLLTRLIGEDIELLSVLEENLGEVIADPSQIEQVILNLAINARDAMPEGGKLTIETANVVLAADYHFAGYPEARSGSYTLLAISDNGVGMTKEVQEKIFEPFFTTKEIGQGTGLGLSTVYGIVQQSDGFIMVYSEVGIGTTFKVYLPQVETNGTYSTQVSSKPLTKTPRSSQRTLKGQARSVLIVEDEKLVQELIERILLQEGYNIFTAPNGHEALNFLTDYDGKIDLIITDIIMPGMGGRELINKLRQQQTDVKVICMSGYTNHATMRQGILELCNGFIQKPFTPEHLLDQINEVLSDHSEER